MRDRKTDNQNLVTFSRACGKWKRDEKAEARARLSQSR
jgi:hypothetical protein